MELYSLPSELRLEVAEYLDPISSFNFAITRKDYWKLCLPVIEEHARQFSQWQTIDAIDPNNTIWATLKEILNNPRKGWYTRELNIPTDRALFWDPNHDILNPDLSSKPPEADQKIFKEAARNLKNFYPPGSYEGGVEGSNDAWNDIVTILEEQISLGLSEPILAILVHHLPSLKTFHFTENWPNTCFHMVMRHIALAYKTPEAARSSRLPFQYLDTVAVAYHFHEDCCRAEWLRYFSCVPSVQYFLAAAIGGYIEKPLSSTDVLRSNIKELVLIRSQFDINALDEILGGIEALEKFTYMGGGMGVSHGAFFESKRVIAALSKYAGHSLEYLLLGHDDLETEMRMDEDIPRTSLRHFKKLKSLECNWKMLYPGDGEDSDDESLQEGFYNEDTSQEFDLKSILPKSLEEIHLYGTFEATECEKLTQQLHDSSAAIPKLDKLCATRKETSYPFGVSDVVSIGHGSHAPRSLIRIEIL